MLTFGVTVHMVLHMVLLSGSTMLLSAIAMIILSEALTHVRRRSEIAREDSASCNNYNIQVMRTAADAN